MSLGIFIDAPFLPIAEYARRTRQSEKTVRNDMESGLLPFYQRDRGSKRLVNMVKLAQLAAADAPSDDPWNNPIEIAKLTDEN